VGRVRHLETLYSIWEVLFHRPWGHSTLQMQTSVSSVSCLNGLPGELTQILRLTCLKRPNRSIVTLDHIGASQV
jgi:hypothetical protein